MQVYKIHAENLPSFLKMRKHIDGLGLRWFSYSQEKRREITKFLLTCKNFDVTPEYIAENIAPGWPLEPEDLVDRKLIVEEERWLPREELMKLKLMIMWFQKLF